MQTNKLLPLIIAAALLGCVGTDTGTTIQWDADVIVVGSGLAGSAAVHGALEKGATVLLIEKNDKVGGTSLYATGTFSAAGTKVQKDKNITDSVQTHIDDINRIGMGKADQALLKKFATEAAGVWDWFVTHGLDQNPAGPFIDPVHSPYTVARTMTPAKNSANEYIKVLSADYTAKYADRLTILLSTTVVDLVKENGRIIGVRTKETAGEKTFYAKAVVLATGGYGSNREMIKKYSPKYAEYRTVTPAHATGEGIVMAEGAGAQLVNMDYMVGYFGGMPKAAGAYTVGFGDLTSGFAENWKGDIWVDKNGRRFVNEDDSDEAPREMALDAIPDARAVIVFDQGILDANGGKVPLRDFDKRLADGYAVKKADTLEALASSFGIPAENLKKTVADCNAAVASGAPDLFGKKTGMVFQKGPYYGVLAYGVIFMTQGGIKTDTSLRTLGKDGKPIPGLYAAGEVMGTTQWGGYGYAGGTGNAPAIVFGLDAGRQAALAALAGK